MIEEKLKHVAEIRVSNVDKKAIEGESPVRLCNYTDVYYNERITDDMEFMIATATTQQRAMFGLRRGDVVLTKDSETADDIGVSAVVAEGVGDLVCGYHLAVVRARPGRAEGRYLRWAIASTISRERLSAAATGVTRFGLRSEVIADLPVPLPPVAEQRAIADYLDRETARIDALIAGKRRMIGLLEERSWRAFHSRVLGSGPRTTQLRRALRSLIDGPFGSAFSSGDYSDEGAAVVRLGNIGFSSYRYTDQARIPMHLYRRFAPYDVVRGDLLIAGLGDERNHAGRACVAPDLGPAIVKGKCFRGRVDDSRANAEFLALLLSSPLGAEAMSISGRGSTRSMINLEIVKSTQIPLPARGSQDAVVAETRDEQARTSAAQATLTRQISLLHERRQALITAAVTGQIAVPVAA